MVNQRLELARRILTEEVQRLEAIDVATRTPEQTLRLITLRNASCAEAAVQLEQAIATGKVSPINSASTLRLMTARDMLYQFEGADIAPPFRGTPLELAQLLKDQLPSPGGRALLVINRADGTAGHVLNAENINGTIWLYEVYSGRAAPVTGQPADVVAVEAFYPVDQIATKGGYSVVAVAP